MDKIVRKTQKTFAGNLVAANNIAKFGSLKIGAPAYSLDPDLIQTDEYLSGWSAALQANKAPALQDMNALEFLWSYQIGYGLQRGVPEWDTNTTYYIGDTVTNSAGQQFTSIIDTSTSNAVTDFAKWQPHGPSIPLGAVIATFPTLTGAYVCTATSVADTEGFVKCNGQQITDVTSPMAGVTIPYVNDSRFIMGNVTSNTTGSAAFSGTAAAHTHNIAHVHAWMHWKLAYQALGGMYTTPAQDVSSTSISTAVSSGLYNRPIQTTYDIPYSGGGDYSGIKSTSTNDAHYYTTGITTGPSGTGSSAVSAAASTDTVSGTTVVPKYITALYIMRIK